MARMSLQKFDPILKDRYYKMSRKLAVKRLYAKLEKKKNGKK